MTRVVNFKGQELFEPDAYSTTDVDGLALPTLEGVGILGLVGEADGGKPGVIHKISAPSTIRSLFRSGDLANGCYLGFRAAGLDPEVLGAASEIYAINVKPNTQAIKDMGSFDAKSKDYGVHTNLINYEILADANDTEQSLAKFVFIKFENKEYNSDSLGLKEHIRLEYKGANGTCTAQVDAGRTKLTIEDATVHDFLFADYPTIGELALAIKAELGADIEVTKPNPYDGFKCSDLDHQTVALDIKTAPLGLRLSAFEFDTWVNTYSNIEVTRKAGATGATIPAATTVATYLAGAVAGVTTNTLFQDALNLLRNSHVNVTVPLISGEESVGTADADTVFAQVKAYLGLANSISGRNEVQAYVGNKILKSEISSKASSMNHRAAQYVPQWCTDLDVYGNQKVYPSWGMAVVYAAIQLGSPIGTSLTNKKIPVISVHQDPSLDPTTDMKQLLLNGYLISKHDDETNVPYIIKGITSVVDSDNNGNTQIEVVESLTQYAYQLRRYLKGRITGKDKGNPNRPDLGGITERDVKTFIEDFSDFAINQKVILAYDPKSISVNITADVVYPKVGVMPREGINFTLLEIEAVRLF